MCCLRNIAMRDYQESVTTGQTHGQTDGQTDGRTNGRIDAGQSDPYVPLFFASDTKNIVAAFRGMHVSPAKHSYAWLPRKIDYGTDTLTDGWTDIRRTKWSLCAAMLRRRHQKDTHSLIIYHVSPFMEWNTVESTYTHIAACGDDVIDNAVKIKDGMTFCHC